MAKLEPERRSRWDAKKSQSAKKTMKNRGGEDDETGNL
jgi:hypothetical protein